MSEIQQNSIKTPFFREGVPNVDSIYNEINRNWILSAPTSPYSPDETLEIVFDSTSISAMSSVPQPWIELLNAQEARSGSLNWNALWKSTLSSFPALDDFLSKKCIGIGLEKCYDGAPCLLYFAYGLDNNLIAFRGAPPLNPHKSTLEENVFNQLPSYFQHFYSNVHNGFGRLVFPCNMPYSLKCVPRLSSLVSDREISPTLSHSYRVNDVFLLADYSGAGDMFAFDVRKLARGDDNCAAIYLHETPSEVDFDQNIRSSFNDLLDFTFSYLQLRND